LGERGEMRGFGGAAVAGPVLGSWRNWRLRSLLSGGLCCERDCNDGDEDEREASHAGRAGATEQSSSCSEERIGRLVRRTGRSVPQRRGKSWKRDGEEKTRPQKPRTGHPPRGLRRALTQIENAVGFVAHRLKSVPRVEWLVRGCTDKSRCGLHRAQPGLAVLLKSVQRKEAECRPIRVGWEGARVVSLPKSDVHWHIHLVDLFEP